MFNGALHDTRDGVKACEGGWKRVRAGGSEDVDAEYLVPAGDHLRYTIVLIGLNTFEKLDDDVDDGYSAGDTSSEGDLDGVRHLPRSRQWNDDRIVSLTPPPIRPQSSKPPT